MHNTVVEEVTEDTYLGDIIRSDGKNTKNIKNRISKEVGKISEIMNLLEMVSLGEHYFEIAILLREAIFINGILTNSEIWYSVSESEIQEFENLDRMLLRRILKVPISTPQESFYLELGILPINVIVKARRINYLHYLVTRNQSEMLYKFFITQWNNPCRGDWTETVKNDLEDMEITSDFNYLKSKSREAFKKLVKEKAREYALEQLTQKQRLHTKMSAHYYAELKPQKYLTLKNANINHIRNIFRFRTRMANFGDNFRQKNNQIMCPLCHNHVDSQSLSSQCNYYKNKMKIHRYMKDIDTPDITLETAITATEMMRLRENELSGN